MDFNYKPFSSCQVGASHVEAGKGCEDYAAGYRDPDGRFCISVICDGHSDSNCFRSAAGARFGCEAGIHVLTRFFQTYHEGCGDLPTELKLRRYVAPSMRRLKMSIKQCWDDMVAQDLAQHPLTPEDIMQARSKEAREAYQAGKMRETIYGATFLALGICKDFFLAMQIGDGTMLVIQEDGPYVYPLPPDPSSEDGSPASLCDGDLLRREEAFRSYLSAKLPVAAVVMSDGIGGLDELDLRAVICKELQTCAAQDDPSSTCFDLRQQEHLDRFVSYWTGKDVLHNDDCSLAGFFRVGAAIPEVRLLPDMGAALLEKERIIFNARIEKLEKDKALCLQKVEEQDRTAAIARGSDFIHRPERELRYLKEKAQLENFKRVLFKVVEAEERQIDHHCGRVRLILRFLGNEDQTEFYLKNESAMRPVPFDRERFALDEDFAAYMAQQAAEARAAAEPAPSDETAEPVPTDEPAEPVPAEDAAEPVPSDDAAEAVPTDETAEPVPSDDAAEPVPSDETAEAVPSDETADPVPSDETAEPVPAEDAAEPVPSDDTAEPVPSDETAEPVPSDDTAEPVPSDDTAEPVPTDETAEPVPTDETAES
ncbi:MAG: protein phosphatase 2C domain-containing protein, partial [Oscillospiraceae bacterium]|nr:protein phosphatase 2C domain-containing protein [Oscillospiraceae bacterium]